MQLNFHHTGLAVRSIEESLPHYAAIFGPEAISGKFKICSQSVNVCFIHLGNQIYIELVEPSDDGSSIHRLLKKGINYYHVAYACPDIEQTVRQLISLGYKEQKYFSSEAFCGKRCIFLFKPDGNLIELIEQ